jgi:hypothetical protein
MGKYTCIRICDGFGISVINMCPNFIFHGFKDIVNFFKLQEKYLWRLKRSYVKDVEKKSKEDNGVFVRNVMRKVKLKEELKLKLKFVPKKACLLMVQGFGTPFVYFVRVLKRIKIVVIAIVAKEKLLALGALCLKKIILTLFKKKEAAEKKSTLGVLNIDIKSKFRILPGKLSNSVFLFLNHAKFVVKQKILMLITQTTQNLLMLGGYVKVAILNTIENWSAIKQLNNLNLKGRML